jgi:hypothetical protein
MRRVRAVPAFELALLRVEVGWVVIVAMLRQGHSRWDLRAALSETAVAAMMATGARIWAGAWPF